MAKPYITTNFVTTAEINRIIKREQRRIRAAEPKRFASRSKAIRTLLLRAGAAVETQPAEQHPAEQREGRP